MARYFLKKHYVIVLEGEKQRNGHNYSLARFFYNLLNPKHEVLRYYYLLVIIVVAVGIIIIATIFTIIVVSIALIIAT